MGLICINCGWENQPGSSICDKCKQPLNYNNSDQDITADNPFSLHSTELSYVSESIEKKIINNRYELTGLIHNDGYSEVWSANDLLTNEIVSLKLTLDAIHNENMYKEYSFLSNYRYAGIYSPLYYDLYEGKAFFVSSEINRSLLDFVGCTDFDVAERFFVQLSSLLIILANQKKCFGALSTNDILVDSNLNLKIMGNAFFQLAEKETEAGKCTISRHNLPYLSPECFFEDKILRNQSIKSDIWSLGAIIYELVTKELPFGPNGGNSLVKGEQYNERFNFYSTAVIDYPRLSRLQYIIYRCLDKEAKNRPSPRFIRDSFMIRSIKSVKKERLFGLAHPSNGLLYSIECDNLSNFTAQVMPGPGPLPHLSQYFLGAFFEDGDECGYLKLEETGRIIEFNRMPKSRYNHLCRLS